MFECCSTAHIVAMVDGYPQLVLCDKFIKVEIVHTKHLILIVAPIVTESQAWCRLLNPG